MRGRFSPQDSQTQLARAVRLVWAASGRRADSEVVALWERKLKPFEGSTLYAILEQEATSDKSPNLGRVLAAIAQKRLQPGSYEPPKLTAAERVKSEHAAILSMLWLENHHPELRESAGGIMRAAFTRQFGTDAAKLVDSARSNYTPEFVDKWMLDQQAAGN